MTVKLINYNQLAQQARDEVVQLDLSEEAEQQLMDLIDAFIELHQTQFSTGYQGWSDFTLRLSSIPEDTYNRFQRVATKLNQSPGKLLNYMMKIILSKNTVDLSAKDLQQFISKPTVSIQHHSELTITAEMLRELQGTHDLVLSHIDHVNISSDIDQSLFSQTVHSIQHCGTVTLPSSLSRLSVMTKCHHCESYKFNL